MHGVHECQWGAFDIFDFGWGGIFSVAGDAPDRLSGSCIRRCFNCRPTLPRERLIWKSAEDLSSLRPGKRLRLNKLLKEACGVA